MYNSFPYDGQREPSKFSDPKSTLDLSTMIRTRLKIVTPNAKYTQDLLMVSEMFKIGFLADGTTCSKLFPGKSKNPGDAPFQGKYFPQYSRVLCGFPG